MAESHVMRRNEAVATDIMSMQTSPAAQSNAQPTFDTAVGDHDIIDAFMGAEQYDNTVFQELNEGTKVDYSVEHIDTAKMQVDGNQKLDGAEAKAEMRETGINECQDKMAQMEKQWDQAQDQAVDCMREAIMNRYQVGESDANAIMQASFPALDGSSGMGSEVTALVGGSSPTITLSEKDLKKGEDEVRSLISDATRIAQSGGPEKRAMQATVSSSGMTDEQKEHQQQYLVSKLSEQGMEQILTQKLEDQKEFKDVADKLDDLHDVRREHEVAAQVYGEKNVLDKAIAHAPAYDDIQQTLGAIERPAAFKAEDIILTSEMVSFSADIERSPNDGLAGIQFDPQTVSLMKSLEANSKEIETTYDASSPELKDMSHQLQGIASQALRV